MKTKKSLQKFTKKINNVERILNLKKITFKDLDSLTKAERNEVYRIMNEKINSINGIERDKFIEQFYEVWTPETKNQLWENNHILITGIISNLMIEYNRMPTNTEIAIHSKLSRQTIQKHLQHYKTNPVFLEQGEQFKILIPSLLAKVYKFASKGDIGAAKLFFSLTGCLNNGQPSKNTLIQNQNNYIQINGTVLSQEHIKKLNPEQLISIESILNTIITDSEFQIS
jgi:hypothetical protein